MATLLRPDNKQPARVLEVTPGRIALDVTCITPARRWWTLAELATVNDRAAIAAACKTPENAPVTCTAITLWRPTVEVPITELGFYKPGSKGVPGVNLHMSNVRIVLTLPDIGKSSGVVFKDAEAA